ncbi:MAG: S9 family peptidase [Chloroflexi bacterium]|nr:S9 family peptidase [Chloroflexota bacterium]
MGTEDDRASVRVKDVRLPDGGEAYVVEPDGGGRGPGVLFLHWFDTEAPDGNRSQFLDEASELAIEIGAVSLLPQGRFPWAAAPASASDDGKRIGSEVAAHRAALDLLVARHDVDAGRIGLVGHDFGGMHGVLLAADDPRIACLALQAVTPRWGDWFLPFWPIAGDRHDYLRALAPLDPIARIPDIAPRPLLLQFARNDFYIAAMTGLELRRAAGEEADMRAYDTDHAMRDPTARRDRLEFLREHLGGGASSG